MSHFSVMVIGADVEKQLAPFDENLEVPKYVEYTKAQLIERGRKRIEDYKNSRYAKYIKDKDAYKAEYNNNGHINYLENEFPLKLNWTDEQVYQNEIDDYEADDISENGGVYSESNPKSKWDWWEVGGRWAGSLKLKEGVKPSEPINFSWGWPADQKVKAVKENRADSALKGEIENIGEIVTFAFLKDGVWYEKGEMGWFGFVANGKEYEQWSDEFKKLIQSLPYDTLITIVDCHI